MFGHEETFNEILRKNSVKCVSQATVFFIPAREFLNIFKQQKSKEDLTAYIELSSNFLDQRFNAISRTHALQSKNYQKMAGSEQSHDKNYVRRYLIV
jgi:hypothetical protein